MEKRFHSCNNIKKSGTLIWYIMAWGKRIYLGYPILYKAHGGGILFLVTSARVRTLFSVLFKCLYALLDCIVFPQTPLKYLQIWHTYIQDFYRAEDQHKSQVIWIQEQYVVVLATPQQLFHNLRSAFGEITCCLWALKCVTDVVIPMHWAGMWLIAAYQYVHRRMLLWYVAHPRKCSCICREVYILVGFQCLPSSCPTWSALLWLWHRVVYTISRHYPVLHLAIHSHSQGLKCEFYTKMFCIVVWDRTPSNQGQHFMPLLPGSVCVIVYTPKHWVLVL